MTRKLRFKWPDQNERTISDIVENDGTMRSREILYIIEKLCTLLRTPDKGNKESAWNSETAGFADPAAVSDPAESTAAETLSDPADLPDPAESTVPAAVPNPSESAVPAAISDAGGPASAFTYSDSAKDVEHPGNPETKTGRYAYIHPDNILVSRNGEVIIADKHIPATAAEPYLPPELDLREYSRPAARVYSLGMLMLFMSTGQSKKDEESAAQVRPALLGLVKRCTAFDPNERFRDPEALLEAVRRRTGIKKRLLPLLITVAAACLAGIVFFYSWQKGIERGHAEGERSGYTPGFSEGFQQGFSDAPGIGIHGGSPENNSGNLAGNYAPEGGAFAVSDGNAVYYISGDKISLMNPYTKDMEILAEVPGVYDLQYYDGKLYFCTGEKVGYLDPETRKEGTVCSSPGGRLYIFEDNFYFYDNEGTRYLYRIDPAQGEMTQLNGTMEYRCLQIVEDTLYYISPEKGSSICRSDLDGGNESVISSSSFEDLCICQNTIYASTGEKLVRMDLNGGNLETLVQGTIHHLNVTDGGIFYTSGAGERLEWLSPDSKTQYTIIPSSTGDFNVAGDWIFYINKEDENRLWRVRAGGTDNIRLTP